jgi:hypothetical protein
MDVGIRVSGMNVMQIKHLLFLLLSLATFVLCGCLARSEASSSPLTAGTSQQEAGGPTSLVPEREPLTPAEVALGLDYEVSRERIVEIAERVRKEGKFGGQGCGMSGPLEDGKPAGAFWDHFLMKFADGEKPEGVTLGYLQTRSASIL